MEKSVIEHRLSMLRSVSRLAKAGYANSSNHYGTIVERLEELKDDPEFDQIYRLAEGGPKLTRITFAYPHIWDRAEDLIEKYEAALDSYH